MFGKIFTKYRFISLCLVIMLLVLGMSGCQMSPDISYIDNEAEFGQVCNIFEKNNELWIVYRVENEKEKKDQILLEKHLQDGQVVTTCLSNESENNTRLSHFSSGQDSETYAFQSVDNEIDSFVRLNRDGTCQTVCAGLEYATKDGEKIKPDGYFITEKNNIVFFYKEIKCLVVRGMDGEKKLEKKFQEDDFSGISYLSDKIILKDEKTQTLKGVEADSLTSAGNWEMDLSLAQSLQGEEWYLAGSEDPLYVVTKEQVYNIEDGKSIFVGIYQDITEGMPQVAGAAFLNNTLYLHLHLEGNSCVDTERGMLDNLEDDTILKYTRE